MPDTSRHSEYGPHGDGTQGFETVSSNGSENNCFVDVVSLI